MGLYDKQPVVSQDVFIAPNASVIGSVTVGEGASIWYGSVLRGDVHDISVGKRSPIGSRSVVHASGGLTTLAPTKIGNNVVVGTNSSLAALLPLLSGQVWAGNLAGQKMLVPG